MNIYKTRAMIPVSHAVLNDMGGDYPEEPLSPEFERWYRWYQQRQAVAFALAAPLGWLGRGASWLHVEAINLFFRILRVNARVMHDSGDEDEDYL